jgi:hypothetical protein
MEEGFMTLFLSAVRRGPFILLPVALALLAFASPVFAQAPADQPDTPVLTGLPLGVIVVSVAMTAVGYVLNYLLPFLRTEQQKGVATAIYQAAGVTIFELATGSDFGLNEPTLVAFITAMAVWGISHGLLFKPTGWNATLGGGRNAADEKQ